MKLTTDEREQLSIHFQLIRETAEVGEQALDNDKVVDYDWIESKYDILRHGMEELRRALTLLKL
jgi:hypothetical protein